MHCLLGEGIPAEAQSFTVRGREEKKRRKKLPEVSAAGVPWVGPVQCVLFLSLVT